METGKLYFTVRTQPTLLLGNDINNANSEFGRKWPAVIQALDACGVKVEAVNFDLAGKNIAITHGLRATVGTAA